MFSPAMILANAKINQLQAEAAAQRLAKKSRNARGESRGTASGCAEQPPVLLLRFRRCLPWTSDTHRLPVPELFPAPCSSLPRTRPPNGGRFRFPGGQLGRSLGVSTSRSVSPAGSRPRHSTSSMRRVRSSGTGRRLRSSSPTAARGLRRRAVPDRRGQRAVHALADEDRGVGRALCREERPHERQQDVDRKGGHVAAGHEHDGLRAGRDREQPDEPAAVRLGTGPD